MKPSPTQKKNALPSKTSTGASSAATNFSSTTSSYHGHLARAPSAMRLLSVIFLLLLTAHASAKTYSQVQAIFNKHCLSCHDPKEQEGGLLLTTHALALKGGDSGPVIIPGKSAESILLQQIE